MPTSKPGYIVTIPMKVNSDAEGSSSEGESSNEFKIEELENPIKTFRMKNWRGIPRKAQPITDPRGFELVHRLQDIFYTRGFLGQPHHLTEAQERLSLVFGLNRRRSMSRSQNKTFDSLLQSQHPIPSSPQRLPLMLGFYWDNRWEKHLGNDKYKEVPFETVLKFYRALKKFDRQKAREFREHYETNKYLGGQKNLTVPYRKLRDTIKNHAIVSETVRTHRQTSDTIFMGIMDADTVDVQHHGIGIFTAYDALTAENPNLVVISTGYRVQNDNAPLQELAVRIDMTVRFHVSNAIRFGIYFPEPNFIVKLENGKDTLDENFSEGNSHYPSPQESNILLKNIISARNIDPQNTFQFSLETPLTTLAPVRFRQHFDAKFQGGKISSWGHDVLKQFRGLSQSHYNPLKLAKNLSRGLEKYLKPMNRQEKNDFHRQLTKLFNYYDPVHIAEELQNNKKHNGFLQSFTDAVLNYGEHIKRPAFYTFKNLEPVTLNNIFEKIKHYLKEDATFPFATLKSAMENAMAALIHIFHHEFFLEPEIIYLQQIMYLLNDCYKDNASGFSCLLEFNSQTISAVRGERYNLCMRMMYNHREGSEIHKDFISHCEEQSFLWQTTPLHWAALFGIETYVDFLLKAQNSSTHTGSKHSKAANGILPLHCAIKMTAIDGYKESLLEKLSNSHAITAKTANGYNAMDFTLLYVHDSMVLAKMMELFYRKISIKFYGYFELEETHDEISDDFEEYLRLFYKTSFNKNALRELLDERMDSKKQFETFCSSNIITGLSKEGFSSLKGIMDSHTKNTKLKIAWIKNLLEESFKENVDNQTVKAVYEEFSEKNKQLFESSKIISTLLEDRYYLLAEIIYECFNHDSLVENVGSRLAMWDFSVSPAESDYYHNYKQFEVPEALCSSDYTNSEEEPSIGSDIHDISYTDDSSDSCPYPKKDFYDPESREFYSSRETSSPARNDDEDSHAEIPTSSFQYNNGFNSRGHFKSPPSSPERKRKEPCPRNKDDEAVYKKCRYS